MLFTVHIGPYKIYQNIDVVCPDLSLKLING